MAFSNSIDDEYELVKSKSKSNWCMWDWLLAVVEVRSRRFVEDEKERFGRNGCLNLLEVISPKKKRSLNLRMKRIRGSYQELFLASCSEPRVVDQEEGPTQFLIEGSAKKPSERSAFQSRTFEQALSGAEFSIEKPSTRPSKKRGYQSRNSDQEEGKASKKTKKSNQETVQLPNPATVLPEEFNNTVKGLGCEEEDLLVNQKEVRESDVKKQSFDNVVGPQKKRTLNLKRERIGCSSQELSLNFCSESISVDQEEGSTQFCKKPSKRPAFRCGNLDLEESDPEFLIEKSSRKPPQKRGYGCRNCDQEEARVSKKTKRSRTVSVQLPNPPPELPEEFKKIIRGMGYKEEAVLVIQKEVYNSDVEKRLGRFAIPVKQVVNDRFLTEEQKTRFTVENKDEMIEVVFIDPSLSVRSLNLKKWYMFKLGGGGQCSCSWVLISGWNDVVKENGLNPGMIVQVWSFRKGSQIGFAMVVVHK